MEVESNARSEAFEWLKIHMPAALSAPDEHTDYIFMLSATDHAELCRLSGESSAEWREAWAYLLALRPPVGAIEALRPLLSDAVSDVAEQAALSVVDLLAEYPDEIKIDSAIRQRLEAITRSDSPAFDELNAYLDR